MNISTFMNRRSERASYFQFHWIKHMIKAWMQPTSLQYQAGKRQLCSSWQPNHSQACACSIVASWTRKDTSLFTATGTGGPVVVNPAQARRRTPCPGLDMPRGQASGTHPSYAGSGGLTEEAKLGLRRLWRRAAAGRLGSPAVTPPHQDASSCCLPTSGPYTWLTWSVLKPPPRRHVTSRHVTSHQDKARHDTAENATSREPDHSPAKPPTTSTRHRIESARSPRVAGTTKGG